jgi:hypothetical protein
MKQKKRKERERETEKKRAYTQDRIIAVAIIM